MVESRFIRKLEVPAHTRNLARVREFLRAAVTRSALPDRSVNRIILAVDEAVANTIQHGYDGNEGSVEVEVSCDDNRFTVNIRDHGVAYDSEKAAKDTDNLDIGKHVSAGKRRGLGLFIMRKVMDEVRYHSSETSGNTLTLVKYISAQVADETAVGE